MHNGNIKLATNSICAPSVRNYGNLKHWFTHLFVDSLKFPGDNRQGVAADLAVNSFVCIAIQISERVCNTGKLWFTTNLKHIERFFTITKRLLQQNGVRKRLDKIDKNVPTDNQTHHWTIFTVCIYSQFIVLQSIKLTTLCLCRNSQFLLVRLITKFQECPGVGWKSRM